MLFVETFYLRIFILTTKFLIEVKTIHNSSTGSFCKIFICEGSCPILWYGNRKLFQSIKQSIYKIHKELN